MSIELACLLDGDHETADWLIGMIDGGDLRYLGQQSGQHRFVLTLKGLLRALWDEEDSLRLMFVTHVEMTLNQLGASQWLPHNS